MAHRRTGPTSIRCGPPRPLPGRPRTLSTVSIITPVLEGFPILLRKTIDSILAQSFPDWELCIVDDASGVGSDIYTLASRDHRIRVERREQPGGTARASNDALAVATGEFVAVVEPGDLLAKGAVATLRR